MRHARWSCVNVWFDSFKVAANKKYACLLCSCSLQGYLWTGYLHVSKVCISKLDQNRVSANVLMRSEQK